MAARCYSRTEASEYLHHVVYATQTIDERIERGEEGGALYWLVAPVSSGSNVVVCLQSQIWRIAAIKLLDEVRNLHTLAKHVSLLKVKATA